MTSPAVYGKLNYAGLRADPGRATLRRSPATTRKGERRLTMETELKPCPSCGGEAKLLGKYVACWNSACHLVGPDGVTESDAVAKWNALPRRDDVSARILKLDERWEVGDVIYYPDGDSTTVSTIAGTYVERPLPERPAKPKRKRLEKLVKRMRRINGDIMNCIEIMDDGSCDIVDRNDEQLETFDDIPALLDFLASLPKREEK